MTFLNCFHLVWFLPRGWGDKGNFLLNPDSVSFSSSLSTFTYWCFLVISNSMYPNQTSSPLPLLWPAASQLMSSSLVSAGISQGQPVTHTRFLDQQRLISTWYPHTTPSRSLFPSKYLLCPIYSLFSATTVFTTLVQSLVLFFLILGFLRNNVFVSYFCVTFSSLALVHRNGPRSLSWGPVAPVSPGDLEMQLSLVKNYVLVSCLQLSS